MSNESLKNSIHSTVFEVALCLEYGEKNIFQSSSQVLLAPKFSDKSQNGCFRPLKQQDPSRDIEQFLVSMSVSDHRGRRCRRLRSKVRRYTRQHTSAGGSRWLPKWAGNLPRRDLHQSLVTLPHSSDPDTLLWEFCYLTHNELRQHSNTSEETQGWKKYLWNRSW